MQLVSIVTEQFTLHPFIWNQVTATGELGLWLDLVFFFYLTLILLRCIQQPCGYNVTGQLQEPKDLTRPATVKVVYTILYSSEASLLQA